MPPAPGAVLVLAHVRDRAAVTVARALCRHGWRVGAGTPRPSAGLVGASRAVSATHVVPRARGTLEEYVGAVTGAVVAGGYDLVVGAGDDWMAALSHVADRLPVPVAAPPPAVVEQALDKLVLVDHAHAVGLAAPRTWLPSEGVDPGTVPLPVIVKSRTHWRPGVTRRHRVEVETFRDVEGLTRQLARIRAHGDDPVLQQPVEGRLGALIGVMHEGRLLGRVQQVARRLWPTPHGASARAVTVPVDPELAGRSEELLRRIGWVGLVELQFLTGNDGTPWLIDFNGRPFGSVALAEGARAGLLDAWVRGALGMPVPDLADGEVGVRYQWLAGDLRRARTERRGGLARDVGGSLRWAVGARHSLTRIDDPGPVAHLLTARFRPDLPDSDAPEPDAALATRPHGATPPLAS